MPRSPFSRIDSVELGRSAGSLEKAVDCLAQTALWEGASAKFVTLICTALVLLCLTSGCSPSGSSSSTPVLATSTNNPTARSNRPAATNTLSLTDSSAELLDPAEVHHLEAAKAIERKEFARAIEELREVVRLKPEDEEGFFELGFVFTRSGQTNEAIRSYEKCLELLPTYSEAHNNLGNILLTQRKFEEAASHFRTAITNQPESSMAYNNLGKCFAMQSKLSDAVTHFRESVRLDSKNWEARYNLAIAYLSAGHLEEGEAELKRLVSENPNMTAAQSALAKVRSTLYPQKPPSPRP